MLSYLLSIRYFNATIDPCMAEPSEADYFSCPWRFAQRVETQELHRREIADAVHDDYKCAICGLVKGIKPRNHLRYICTLI
jgi:hypothetical protein